MSKINAIVLVASLWASEGSATPVIQEVFYDALGPDTSSVFTELYGCPGTALNGWSLVGVNGANGRAYRTLELTGAVIPADGLLVLATASAAGTLTRCARLRRKRGLAERPGLGPALRRVWRTRGRASIW